MSKDKATTVRVPQLLKEEFEDMSNKKRWLNFADFSREAIRDKLNRERLLVSQEIVEREEPGPLRSSREKPSS